MATRKNQNPTYNDWTKVKRIFRYLAGTTNFGILYSKDINDPNTLVGYSDSDFGNADDRKSTTGFVFCLNSSPISWISRKQASTATSTCVAEYFALCEATKEALYLRKVLQNLIHHNPILQ